MGLRARHPRPPRLRPTPTGHNAALESQRAIRLQLREHDLELNALLCELAARAAAHTDTTGPLWHAAPFRILGPRASRIDPDHETRPSDADPINQLPIGHVVRPGTSQRGVLEPDATLLGRHATTDQPISVLIEYDRTRRATKLIAKLARYDHFLTDGWRRTAMPTNPTSPPSCSSPAPSGTYPTRSGKPTTS